MQIRIKYRGQEKVLDFDKSKVRVKDILEALGLSSDYAFVVKNGEIASEDEEINENDQIKVVNAISGG